MKKYHLFSGIAYERGSDYQESFMTLQSAIDYFKKDKYDGAEIYETQGDGSLKIVAEWNSIEQWKINA